MIRDKLSHFLAVTGAMLKGEIERVKEAEKIQARNQIRTLIMQNMQIFHNLHYATVLELFMKAINSTTEVTGLPYVKAIEMLTTFPPVAASKKGFYYFKFRGVRSSKSDITASMCSRVLQRELDELSLYYNYQRLYIQAKFEADGYIRFCIAFFGDVERASL